MLFGINLPTSSGADPVAHARAAEALGFDFVSANDHPSGNDPTNEVWTMLAWIAAHTSRIAVAPRVLGIPYRPPAIVAKMAETLDRLSGARLILGLGGGARDDAMRAFGAGAIGAGEKMERLEEAIRVMRGLWTEKEFTFEGAHYRTERATLEPKPERRIPLWLGTYGPRGLALVGRFADGWIPSYELAPPEVARAMRESILDAAGEAGRDAHEITCVYNMEIHVGRALSRPGIVSGTAEEVAEQLAGFARLGFTAMNLIPWGPDVDEQRELLARDVIPAVRA